MLKNLSDEYYMMLQKKDLRHFDLDFQGRGQFCDECIFNVCTRNKKLRQTIDPDLEDPGQSVEKYFSIALCSQCSSLKFFDTVTLIVTFKVKVKFAVHFFQR